MGFFKSAINQVGRDLGKVVSNEIFKDSHSTPVRITGRSQSSSQKQLHSNEIHSKVKKFEKSIAFNTSYTPKTLINKLSGSYTILKNITRDYISDGHLDSQEIITLTELNMSFNLKCDDIHEVLSLDKEENEKELALLNTLFNRNVNLWIDAMKESVDHYSNEIRKHSKIVDSNNKEIESLKSGLFGSIKNRNKVTNLESTNIELKARISRDIEAKEYLEEMVQKLLRSEDQNMT